MHRVDHVPGYRSHFEEDSGALPALPARRSQQARRRGHGEDPRGPQGTRYEEFHGVTYQPEALRAAAELSSKYLHDRKRPDKAIDLVGESGAAKKLETSDKVGTEPVAEGTPRPAPPVVTVSDVEAVLARMAQPPARLSTSDRERLRDLETELRSVVFGQEEALHQLVAANKLSRAGLRAPENPIGSFLLTGPTGVGKTEAANQLAKVMGVAFHRFDAQAST